MAAEAAIPTAPLEIGVVDVSEKKWPAPTATGSVVYIGGGPLRLAVAGPVPDCRLWKKWNKMRNIWLIGRKGLPLWTF